MKKHIAFALVLPLFLTACGAPGGEKGETELVVFAAASLTETLDRIAEGYEAEAPGVKLVFNFDSSGTLRTQIGEGAQWDLFLSAAPRQMDEVEQAGLLLEGSRVDLLENKVVLAVPEGNPAGIDSYDGLIRRLSGGDVLLAIGNSDVPVGQYTRKIFAYYGLEEDTLSAARVLTYGSNVKEVTSQVIEGAVDCGIIYATDAFSAGLTVADTAAAEMCGQVLYPAGINGGSAHPKEARAFLDYLRGETAGEVFSAVGFTPLS